MAHKLTPPDEGLGVGDGGAGNTAPPEPNVLGGSQTAPLPAEPLRIDVGCGTQCLAGYLGVDRYVESADVVADMWDLPFADESVDEIYSAHALEHVATAQVMPTLLEWKRVLKPSGVITLLVPDMRWICENFLKNPSTGWDMATVFGSQTHEGEFHKTGFTREIMVAYIAKAKMKLVEHAEIHTHGQRTLKFVITKRG